MQILYKTNIQAKFNFCHYFFFHICVVFFLIMWSISFVANYYDAAGAERKIDEICCDYQNDGVKEKIYRCLLAWNTLSDEVYLDDIISSLEAHEMLDLADDLNRNYASLLKAYHEEGECDLRDQE